MGPELALLIFAGIVACAFGAAIVAMLIELAAGYVISTLRRRA